MRQNQSSPDIAVVAMSGIFPGASNPEMLWQNIIHKRESISEIPQHRWISHVNDVLTNGYEADKAISNRAGLIRNFQFDPAGIDLSETVLDSSLLMDLDPLYHLVLRAAGDLNQKYRMNEKEKKRAGVILAAIALPTQTTGRVTRKIFEPAYYNKSTLNRLPDLSLAESLGCRVTSLPAQLISAALGLDGTCFTLDAACASSLYAIKLACDTLSDNRADMMIAGGVSRPDCLFTQIGFSQLRALSPTGRCAPFDQSADGLVVGEGIGLFALKRLHDALTANDDILAVIKGIGLSNDMRGNLLAPETEGQLRAMSRAYDAAGWRPWDVDHIECHGAGTPMGDRIELNSLHALWKQAGSPSTACCALGSVKSMIGHLLTAAGAAGLMKSILAMRHRILPPSLNFTKAPENSPLHSGPFHVQTLPEPWGESSIPGRAAVSAFGFGGINAHLLIEAWPEAKTHAPPPENFSPDFFQSNKHRAAIVGMAVRIGKLTGFSQTDRITFSRWPDHRRHGLDIETGKLSYAEFGHYIDDVPISPFEFHIPPSEISDILPQQLLMLKVSAEALANAGMNDFDTPNPDMGAVIGIRFDMEASHYHLRWNAANRLGKEQVDSSGHSSLEAFKDRLCPPLTATRTLGSLGSIVAGRIAREFKFGGPSYTVSSDEASGLTALETAVGAICRGEQASVLVGAVDLCGDIRCLLSQHRINEHFDLPWKNQPPGEGAVALVVKNLEAALRDGDRIYAVVESDHKSDTRDTNDDIPGFDISDLFPKTGYTGAVSGLAAVAHAARSQTSKTRISCPSFNPLRKSSGYQVFLDMSPKTIPDNQIPDVKRDIVKTLGKISKKTANAHQSFLDLSQNLIQTYADTLALQNRIIAKTGAVPVPPPSPAPLFSRNKCLEFAVGSVENVLGPEFAPLDTQNARVRLPDEPLMLVDRIIRIEGKKLSLDAGRIITEHDVRPDAWYLDGGRAPACISVEAGQADLFLCAYLGADHQTKGKRTYRLLDATVTFHRSLPRPGDVIRYDIHIDRFVRQGDTWMFFFRFDGAVNDEPLISMREGCAGFFTAEEVENSGGIIVNETGKPGEIHHALPEVPYGKGDVCVSPAGHHVPPECPLPSYPPDTDFTIETYDDEKISALRRGDLETCFGDRFRGIVIPASLRIPGGRLHLIDRVTHLDPKGGKCGLGVIRAEADIAPDAWFLTCHFVDDRVMPGTLMYECCAHTLRVFLQRIGWIPDNPEARYEPVPGIAAKLKCRGPVTPDTKKVIYEVEIKKLGYGSEPFAVADARMFADGRYIVLFQDMSMRLTHTAKTDIDRLWETSPADRPAPIFNRRQFIEFVEGSPSLAFGRPYQPFDKKRFIARLPKPPYLFMDRVVSSEPFPWKLEPGGFVESEYHITADDWYFTANRAPVLPLAILMEIALQPCGWLAAYMGSALQSEKDLHFRNLEGTAVIRKNIRPGGQSLRVRVRLTHVSKAADMIIEAFEFKVMRNGEDVYEGTTNFGFFTTEALSRQKGIQNPTFTPFVSNDASTVKTIVLPKLKPLSPSSKAPGNLWDVRMDRTFPAKALRMIDKTTYHPDGGHSGTGFIVGEKPVDPDEWFFKAHFHQDPVCPGSLGIESFIQLLRVAAFQKWSHLKQTHAPFLLCNQPHSWQYRGQIIPENKNVRVEAHVSDTGNGSTPYITGNGILSVDGLTIYEMKDFGIQMRAAG